jgi:hypothetical protein
MVGTPTSRLLFCRLRGERISRKVTNHETTRYRIENYTNMHCFSSFGIYYFHINRFRGMNVPVHWMHQKFIECFQVTRAMLRVDSHTWARFGNSLFSFLFEKKKKVKRIYFITLANNFFWPFTHKKLKTHFTFTSD